jgi:hypothetical protein
MSANAQNIPTARDGRGEPHPAVNQAFRALQIGFVAAPILAGLDKFVGLMTDWTQYLWPPLAQLSGLSPGAFMRVVGVVEVVAGILVAVRPRLGGYIVAGWLGGIMTNLILAGGFWDIALRDLGLAVGAFALARLATANGS